MDLPAAQTKPPRATLASLPNPPFSLSVNPVKPSASSEIQPGPTISHHYPSCRGYYSSPLTSPLASSLPLVEEHSYRSVRLCNFNAQHPNGFLCDTAYTLKSFKACEALQDLLPPPHLPDLTLLPFSLPCLLQFRDKASLLFLKKICTFAPGPLHVLFPLPGTYLPQIPTWPVTPCLQLKSHLVREVFSEQFIHKSAPHTHHSLSLS